MTTAQRINKARDYLAKAYKEIMGLSTDALKIIDESKDGDVEASSAVAQTAGARYRLTVIAGAQVDNIRNMLWELPGVDWQEKPKREPKSRKANRRRHPRSRR